MEETISLKEIFGVLKKRILLIISFVVGAALISAIVTFFMLTPEYESSSEFIVNQSQQESEMAYNDVNDIRTNVELISTYNIIIKSPAILEDVAGELNLDLSTTQLSEKINVENAENSQVVTVTATDPDPSLARDIANTTVTTFQSKIPDIMNVDNVSVLSEAEVKAEPTPVSPKPLLNIAIAVVLGGMIGVGLAFLLEYLDNTIKTESDIEDKLGIPVLGVISHIDDSDIKSNEFQPSINRVNRGGYSGTQTQKKSI
ncbi:Capsular polysaccharide biosynthesis protein [Lentibacillus halodurans]|uniref:Capsular polysaccharide biosynthesis protein n=1 Tax=Lentibacillus halodurans TaxID=237679 RepID=A0A1I0XJF5_9BACI|nr:Wzz/FepE/Etk N-terminal domain-containing protein [Lentibacillus halodurans]SFB00827.1 Capsular polysaccharide biosynthesis protein [Lentibacillus halodurans]